jgi:hypothetical protein
MRLFLWSHQPFIEIKIWEQPPPGGRRWGNASPKAIAAGGGKSEANPSPDPPNSVTLHSAKTLQKQQRRLT